MSLQDELRAWPGECDCTLGDKAADRIERLEIALREVMFASGPDDDELCQHYSWIHDTAKQALEGEK